MLTDSPGIPTHRPLGVALFVLASLAAALDAAPPSPPPIVETNYFVLPNKPIGGATETPRAADFRATVGKEAYEVRSVSRAADWKDLKTVVVFDLASAAAELRPCLIEQAKLVAPRLLKEKNVQLYVVSSEWTEFHNHFSYGDGPSFEYFLPEPGTATGDPCATLPALKSKLLSDLKQGGSASSEEAMADLAQALKTKRGPVRVFWVGEKFLWFHTERLDSQSVRLGAESWYDYNLIHPPNAAYRWVDQFTRAGVNVSPIIWLNGDQETVKVTAQQKVAAEIARYLGGQEIACNRDLGPCLENALASSAQGWVVQVAGPAVERTSRYGLESIELWYQPEPAVLDLKRPFLHGAMTPGDNRAPSWSPTAALAVPLFDTEWLTGKAGCDSGSGSGGRTAAMTLLPASALSDGTDKLQTFVEFLGTDPAQSNSAPTQRKVRATAIDEHMHLKVRQGAGQPFANEKIPGKVEVCVDLPSPTSAKGSYRVVVFNPKTGWAGVGVLPVADVVEYLQQH